MALTQPGMEIACACMEVTTTLMNPHNSVHGYLIICETPAVYVTGSGKRALMAQKVNNYAIFDMR